MRIRIAGILGLAAVAVGGCSASSGEVAGGKLSATGCQSQLSVGDQMTTRIKWTAPGSAKYTLLWLDGADNFTINNIFDETLSHAKSNDISGEYDLPGPRKGQTKTIAAVITANKPGNNTVNITVWGSNEFNAAPPDSSSPLSCDVAINP